ncbi:MAG: hypothetical protein JW864_10635 [Spirochaetes bacterium]|nr:hypothetical protein [Spirochaetota bacterium]
MQEFIKKHLFKEIIVLEIIFNIIWIFFFPVLLENSTLQFIPFSVVVFPLVYASVAVHNISRNKSWKIFFLSFIPIFTLLLFGFIKDGTTTYLSNPDASTFGWMIFFSIFRLIVNVILLLLILGLNNYYSKKNKQ